LPRLAAIVLVLLIAGSESRGAEPSLLAKCRQLFTSPGFDCECVVTHLDPSLAPVEAEIALEAWSLSLRSAQESNRGFEALYGRHHISAVNRALFHFILRRTDLLMKCPQSGPEGKDDY
jgi:hypothetical protein